MFRRRDEDEIEFTLQPANRNSSNASNSGFAATNQAPGQMIKESYTPNNTPYNPAAHSLAQAAQQQVSQAQNQTQSQASASQPPQQAPVEAPTAKATQATAVQDNSSSKAETQTSKESKTTTSKATTSMNTFVPSAIRASSNQTNTPAPQVAPAAPVATAAPKQQPIKDIGLETERRLTVGYGISLEGKVSDCDKLVIYGQVNAELNNVKALQISDSGCFRGAAEIDYAEISGIFEGELRVRKNIVISSTGRVSGKITYSSIEIKPGGKFTGEIIESKTDSDNVTSGSNNEQKAGEGKGEDFNLFPAEQKETRAA